MVGCRLSVVISSWTYEVSPAHSHMVSTRLRSTPSGRGGASGTSPAAMRSLQSANIARPRSRPNRFSTPLICAPRCPKATRWSHASTEESNPSRWLRSKVNRLPIW